MGQTESLPLFPLQTVLLPGAALGLRLFERRYIDMVRDCGRHGHGFGICLVLDGDESGAPATPAAFGTEAVIEDFGSGADGLLTLQVRGARRFHVERTRVRDSGLIVGDLAWRAPDRDDPLRPEHALLATVLQHFLEKVGGEHSKVSQARYEEAAWVGWRLAEFMPLTDLQRLAVLQEDDLHARLDRILQLMP
ncbi:MAG TPA: LON peptidase substrate-binding domain-containing protein [Pseudoxanthomonas sp.]|nr:LON peptidase substrate-binding domain-containing protein [Pseudoxanthomonas sp.]